MMTSYKKLYEEKKKQLKTLESNCIDLRDHHDLDHPIIFDTNKWELIYHTKQKYLVAHVKNPVNW